MKRRDWLIGLAAAIGVGTLLSPLASPLPDGLEWVAEKLGFLEKAHEQPLISAPLPDYSIPWLHSPSWSTAVAGAVGVMVVFGALYFIARWLRKPSREEVSSNTQDRQGRER